MPVHQETVPPKLGSPAEAVRAMMGRLGPVGVESVPLHESAGRVLAEPVVADRPSPASDVSAMDGYAVRLSEPLGGELRVVDSILPGRPAPPMPDSGVLRVMTGAVVPSGADAVVKREDVEELGESIRLHAGVKIVAGQHVRRRGENLAAGETVVDAGVQITPGVMAGLAAFGAARVKVFQKVRLALIVTGDELLDVDQHAEDWQIRDSNGPALRAMLSGCPWVEYAGTARVADEYPWVLSAALESLTRCDALLLTGGVSAGTHDFVPDMLRKAGCDVVFHKLPQKPGGPMLGAVGPGGQSVFGLPGNPQSALIAARRIAVPALRKRAGFAEPLEKCGIVGPIHPQKNTLGIWWFRLVRMVGEGVCEYVSSHGSGDVAAIARSDGFLEVPPGESDREAWEYYPWRML